jgi:glycopeptide antibiotics resistance protein
LNNQGKKNVCFNILLYGVFAFYIFLLIVILFRTHHAFRSANLIPFRGIVSYLIGKDFVIGNNSATVLHAFALSNLLGNIVLFIPLGAYITLFRRGKGLWMNTLWIFITSVAVEIIQYAFKRGIGDIDDVILNTIGGFIGILLCRLLYSLCKDDIKVRRIVGIIAPIIGVLFFVILYLVNR